MKNATSKFIPFYLDEKVPHFLTKIQFLEQKVIAEVNGKSTPQLRLQSLFPAPGAREGGKEERPGNKVLYSLCALVKQ